MQRGCEHYLQDIIDNAGYIKAALAGRDFDGFSSDRTLQAAIERFIEIIGEAAKRVPDTVRTGDPADWKLAARMRDVLAHDYPSIMPRIVWDTATDDVQRLEAAARRVLESMTEQE